MQHYPARVPRLLIGMEGSSKRILAENVAVIRFFQDEKPSPKAVISAVNFESGLNGD